MEYLRAINPIEQPTGEVEMPGYRLTWASQPIRDTVRTRTMLGTHIHDVSGATRFNGTGD